MKYMYVILVGVWPYIKLYHPHTFFQCLYNWDITAVTRQLIPRQVRIVSSEYKIMRQWRIHIMVNLKEANVMSKRYFKKRKTSIIQSTTPQFQYT